MSDCICVCGAPLLLADHDPHRLFCYRPTCNDDIHLLQSAVQCYRSRNILYFNLHTTGPTKTAIYPEWDYCRMCPSCSRPIHLILRIRSAVISTDTIVSLQLVFYVFLQYLSYTMDKVQVLRTAPPVLADVSLLGLLVETANVPSGTSA